MGWWAGGKHLKHGFLWKSFSDAQKTFLCNHLRKSGLAKTALEIFFRRKVLIQRGMGGWMGWWEGSENGFLWEHPPPLEPPFTTQDKWEQWWGLGAKKGDFWNKNWILRAIYPAMMYRLQSLGKLVRTRVDHWPLQCIDPTKAILVFPLQRFIQKFGVKLGKMVQFTRPLTRPDNCNAAQCNFSHDHWPGYNALHFLNIRSTELNFVGVN